MDITQLLNPVFKDFSSKCSICNKIFSNRHARERHELTVHAKALNCPFCSKQVKYKGRPDLLRQHLIRCTKYIPIAKDSVLWEKEIRDLYDSLMVKSK